MKITKIKDLLSNYSIYVLVLLAAFRVFLLRSAGADASYDIVPLSTFDYDFNSIDRIDFLLQVVAGLIAVFYNSKWSTREWIVGVFFLLCVFHLFPEPYFYFDEWHVLQRFSEQGLPGVIYTHNEHFLPVYFLWEYLTVSIFGNHYTALLTIGLLLTTFYVVLIEKVIRLFINESTTSRLLSLLFCVSALHSETLQWAFQQSMTISAILGFGGLLLSYQYMLSGNYKHLVSASFMLLLAPLSFGLGFLYFPVVGIALVFLRQKILLVNGEQFIYFKRLCTWAGSAFVSALIPVCLYYINKDASSGHGMSEVSFWEHPSKVFDYIVVGLGLGSFIRPLGLYPTLSMSTFYDAFQLVSFDRGLLFLQKFPEHGLIPEVVVSQFMLAFVFFLGIILFVKNKEQGASYFFGLLFLLLFFTLISFGRYNLGVMQSLALRYQYLTLPGLLLMLEPVIVRTKVFLASRYVQFFLLLWIMQQAFLIQTFSYFRTRGTMHEQYVEQLDYWVQEGRSNGEQRPPHQHTITPGRGWDKIHATYSWVSD